MNLQHSFASHHLVDIILEYINEFHYIIQYENRVIGLTKDFEEAKKLAICYCDDQIDYHNMLLSRSVFAKDGIIFIWNTHSSFGDTYYDECSITRYRINKGNIYDIEPFDKMEEITLEKNRRHFFNRYERKEIHIW